MRSSVRLMVLGVSVAAMTGLLLPNRAEATVVYATPSGVTDLPLPTVNYVGTGPETIAAGVTWTSNDSSSQFGGQFGTSFNSSWWDGYGTTVIPNYMADPYYFDTMTISFSSPEAFFGAYVVWNTGESGTISAYDSTGGLIDSIVLTTLTPATCSPTQPGGSINNCGNTVGLLESSDDISKIVFSGGQVGATNLSVATTAQLDTTVPEPASAALLFSALAGLVLPRRRKQVTD